MRRLRVVLFLSVFALALCSTAGIAIAEPFSASGAGTFTLTGVSSVEATGTATATAGPDTIVGSFHDSANAASIPEACPREVPFSGELTLEDATFKDELKQLVVGEVCSGSAGDEAKGTFTIERGTGRFAGTTGSGTFTSILSFTTDTATFSESGTINFPTAKHPTSTTVECEPKTVVAGQPTKCTATVTDTSTSGASTPMGTVSFKTSGPGSFNQTSCTLSGSGSSTSCSVTYMPGSTPSEPVRMDTITAEYKGDSTHEESEGTTKVTVISPTALAHGAFVIGNEDATLGRAVTFYEVEWWGSQWWRRNSLSGGRAPSDFKGFAESASSPPECNKEWTTNAGNSSGPPAAVPEYMEVIGASKITQSGSTIKGNAPKLAVVKTNPGYLPNPGHKGTGKVVAVIECS